MKNPIEKLQNNLSNVYNEIQNVKHVTPDVKKCQIQVLLEPNIMAFDTLKNLLSEFRKVVFYYTKVFFPSL